MGTVYTRNAPIACKRWLWSQHWLDLLFVHWRVSAESLRPHVPVGLEIDTCAGAAWVSAVAFHLARIRHRGLPPVWPVSAFPELNLRTYVRHGSESGICFLSIHAGQWLATRLAGWFTGLPYLYAPIRYRHANDQFHFHCPGPGFTAEWTTAGPSREVGPYSIDAWLLERYALYLEKERGSLLRTKVEHRPWAVCSARLTIRAGGLGSPFGLNLGAVPDAAHFSSGVRARVWPFVPAGPAYFSKSKIENKNAIGRPPAGSM
jgi:uncharacterized protein YqjF (DUF2071 family)